MDETKNEPTLFVNERDPSAIMTGDRQSPIQVAMMSNGNGTLSNDEVAAFRALFVAAPEIKRQRDALIDALKDTLECLEWRERLARYSLIPVRLSSTSTIEMSRALIAEFESVV